MPWRIYKIKYYIGLFRNLAPQTDHTNPVLLWTDSCTLFFFMGVRMCSLCHSQVRHEFFFQWNVCVCVCLCVSVCACEVDVKSVPSYVCIYIHTHTHTHAHTIYTWKKLFSAYTHIHTEYIYIYKYIYSHISVCVIYSKINTIYIYIYIYIYIISHHVYIYGIHCIYIYTHNKIYIHIYLYYVLIVHPFRICIFCDGFRSSIHIFTWREKQRPPVKTLFKTSLVKKSVNFSQIYPKKIYIFRRFQKL